MITKGNNTKVQNEVIAQTITDETAKRLKLARLFPKQEIKENLITIHTLDKILILMRQLTKDYLERLKTLLQVHLYKNSTLENQ